jgi:hypothetical protein
LILDAEQFPFSNPEKRLVFRHNLGAGKGICHEEEKKKRFSVVQIVGSEAGGTGCSSGGADPPSEEEIIEGQLCRWVCSNRCCGLILAGISHTSLSARHTYAQEDQNGAIQPHHIFISEAPETLANPYLWQGRDLIHHQPTLST